MGGGESSDGQCSNTKPYSCPVKIKILVVDDDQIALTIVSTMLRRNDHQVFTARDPLEALSTLRERPGFFNLVITDFHMPHMNGSELQRQIDIEFKLPVVMMSSDDKESTMVQSLRNGAVFFLVKPVKQEDLKNIWQYALSVKKGKSILVEESGSLQIGESSATTVSRGDEHNALGNKLQSGDNNPPSREQDKCDSSSETSNDKNPRKNCKQKGKRSKDDRDNFDHTYLAATKKAKVVWTNSLHTRFLQAIRFIGLDKAVPKRILEFMCVPGLTRENVASHLQKYRMFLRRVAEKTASQTFGEQIMKSSFAYGHEFASSGVAQGYARSIVEQRRQALARYYGGQQVQAGTPYNFSQRASSSNPRSQSSYDQPNQCYNASSSNPKSQFSYGQPNQYYNGGQIFSNTTNYWDSQRQGIMANFESSLSSGDTSFGLMGSVGSLNNSQHTFAQPQDAGIVSSSMAPYNNGYYNGMMGASNSSIGSQFPTKNYNYAGLGVGSNGGLTINGQSLSGSTSNGNTSFGFGVGSSQAGFLFNNDGDQDDNDFDMMNDNSFALDNMINMHLMGLTLDDDDAFVDQFINYQMPPPNQGGYPNPNLSSSSSYNGQNPLVNQLRSVDFLSLGNEGQDSWGGQMLSQLESGGQVMSSMKNGTNPTLNKAGSYDVFGYQSPRDQGNRSRQVLNSGQIRMDPTTSEASSSSKNQLTYDQEWDYELLEAFLRGDHA